MSNDARLTYTSSLERLADLGDTFQDHDAWNEAVAINHDAYLALRATGEGRAFIETLLEHELPAARGWAAAHVLLWNEAAARPVLEHLAESGGFAAISAEQTLRSFDGGTLTHDW